MSASAIDQFREALRARNIIPPVKLLADGELHRCDADGKNGKGDAAYVLHLNGVPAGGLENHRDGQGWENWTARVGRTLSPVEAAVQLERVAAARKKRDEDQSKRHAKVAANASALWEAAAPASADHRYLRRKGIEPHGARVYRRDLVIGGMQCDGALMIRMRDLANITHDIQFIAPDGEKRFLPGGRKRGLYCGLPGDRDKGVLLCEGFATGASVFEATGQSTLVAFDSANLEPVARALREAYPDLRITVCADDDVDTRGNPGLTKAAAAAKAVNGLVAVPDFGTDRPAGATDFNDLALHRGVEVVKQVIASANVPADDTAEAPAKSEGGEVPVSAPARFTVNDDGVRYSDKNGDVWVCSRLEVVALARDRGQANWGRLLEFRDPDGKLHRWAMPMEMLRGGGDDLRGALLSQGVRIAPGLKARNKLAEYISLTDPRARARCVERTGWYKDIFVLPHRTVGEGPERVLYQAESVSNVYGEAGSLEEWRNRVSALCTGNTRLVLAVSTAFASMALESIGAESGGLHLCGDSSTGKTTVLRVAASVFGPPYYLHRWRATTNGLEALAALHNDTLLVLDELAQVDAREAGETAYMLANGSGKARAARMGGARRQATWRLLFLSAGEIGLAQHMRDAGKKVKAGQEVRLVEIPADTGAGLGIFEELHGRESGAALSRELTDVTANFYGTPTIAFLEALTNERLQAADWLRQGLRKFVEAQLPRAASGQAHRVCERFALVGIAGEYATAQGITDWPQGEALTAAAKCFQAWLECRGVTGNLEASNIKSAVRAFFEQHGESRFTDLNAQNSRDTINRAGFRRQDDEGKTEFLVLPESFKKEVCAGFQASSVVKVLLKADWLRRDSGDDKPQAREYLPGLGRVRVYLITAAMWNEEAEHAS